jgi:DNA-binding NarL/FixJ family response regulator
LTKQEIASNGRISLNAIEKRIKRAMKKLMVLNEAELINEIKRLSLD